MEARELRVGSYVKYNGMVLSVIGINHPTPCEDIRYRDKWVIDLLCDGIITCTLDELEPLNLTEEWLVKLGFEEDCDRFVKSVRSARYVIESQDDWFFIGIKPDNYTYYFAWEIKTVHRLQNIWQSMTGQELEISHA